MTKEEARKVLEILATADTGCNVCAGRLFSKFVKAFPGLKTIADEVWKSEFEGYTYEEEDED